MSAGGGDRLARTGCDLQSVAEVEDAVRDFGPRYLDRVYTAGEQRSLATGGVASLAARFAAKEAVLKLLGGDTADIGGVDLRSVEITRGPHGRPAVRLHDRAADLARAAGIDAVDVSLSHAGGLALAVAVALADPIAEHSPDPSPDPTPDHSTAGATTAPTTSEGT